MNKTELVNKVAAKTEMTKKDTAGLVDAVFNTITETMNDKEDVAIANFGKFHAKEQAERQGHNPATGEPLTIPKKTVPKFKAGKQLKESVNQ